MKKVLAFSDVHGVTEGLEDILSNVEYDILVYLGD
jgi:predicted phosphodiesterase